MPDQSGRSTSCRDCGGPIRGATTFHRPGCDAGRSPSPATVEREREALKRMLAYDVPTHIDRDAALWGAATVLLLLREIAPARGTS